MPEVYDTPLAQKTPFVVVMLPNDPTPVTATDDSVPRDVTFGCAAVPKVPVTVVNVPVEAVTDVAATVENVPLVAETLPAAILPVTFNKLSVPRLVMFGCAAVLKVPVNVAPVFPIVPAFTVVAATVVNLPVCGTAFPIIVLLMAANDPVELDVSGPNKFKLDVKTTLPVTVNPVSEPRLFMLGCAFVLSVPVKIAPVFPMIPASTVLATSPPPALIAPDTSIVVVVLM